MASIYDLKPRFQMLLRPLAGRMVKAGITANTITLLALAGSIGVGATIALAADPGWLLLVPVWLFVRMALNAIDGMMAREFDQKTTLGAYLNEVGDVLSDAALYLPMAISMPQVAPAVVAFTLGAALTEFCGVLGSALGGSRAYHGPMGKSDRAFLFGALALALAVFPAAADVAPWVLWLGFALELATCSNRVRAGLSQISTASESTP